MCIALVLISGVEKHDGDVHSRTWAMHIGSASLHSRVASGVVLKVVYGCAGFEHICEKLSLARRASPLSLTRRSLSPMEPPYHLSHDRPPIHAISSAVCQRWAYKWQYDRESFSHENHRFCNCEPASQGQLLDYVFVKYLVGSHPEDRYERSVWCDSEDEKDKEDKEDKEEEEEEEDEGDEEDEEEEEHEEGGEEEEHEEDRYDSQSCHDWCNLLRVSVHWAQIFGEKVHKTRAVLCSDFEDLNAFKEYSARRRLSRFPGIIDYRKRPVISTFSQVL